MEKDRLYIGKVIYNEDPTYSGRCKIKVFGLFDSLEDKFIPWFNPTNSEIFSTSGGGSISVPKIGQIVRVKFLNNDLYSGEYTSLQCLDPAMIEEIKDDYLGTHVLLFDAEAELMVLYQEKTGFKIYHKGSHIVLDPTGMIQAKHSNDNNVIEIKDNEINITTVADSGGSNSSTGVIHIASNNKVEINVPNGTCNVNAQTVNLGNNAMHPAVKGDTLQTTLMKLAGIIDTKYPPGPMASADTFADILSNTVKVAD